MADDVVMGMRGEGIHRKPIFRQTPVSGKLTSVATGKQMDASAGATLVPRGNWGGTAGMAKFAAEGGGYHPSWGHSGDLGHFPARWTTPLLSFINYYIPWDRAVLYQWIRYYDMFHPVIGAAIDTHYQLPLSRFGLKGIKDRKVLREYEEIMEEMGSFLLMCSQLREYWLIGEVFTLLYWDDGVGAFTDGEVLMPEYVDVKGHPIALGGEYPYEYSILPDPSMRDFLDNPDPQIQNLKKNIPKEIIESVSKQEGIRIDPFNLMVMIRKQCPYHLRGTSVVLRAFPDLLYETKLREAQYAIAERHITPKEHWKVGDKDFIPDDAYMASVQALIEDAENQPLFNLLTAYCVSHEIYGATGKFPNLAAEFDWAEKRELTALFINKAITTGEGPTYANASVAIRALLSRYIPVRTMLENGWKLNVFLPIALKRQYYEITPAELSHNIRKPFSERQPIVPEFDWRYKQNLLDDSNFRNLMWQIRQDAGLPMKIICESIGVDYDYAKDQMEREEGTVFDPLYQTWRKELKKAGLDENKCPKLIEFLGKYATGGNRDFTKDDIVDGAVKAALEQKEKEDEGEDIDVKKPLSQKEEEDAGHPVDLSSVQFASKGGFKRKLRLLQACALKDKEGKIIGFDSKNPLVKAMLRSTRDAKQKPIMFHPKFDHIEEMRKRYGTINEKE